ncbi:hypothetical protein PINS_up013256 [Pythium insidiosum]|nr:hypothetical protein PINS_up013256 [Pythium insidiosum]
MYQAIGSPSATGNTVRRRAIQVEVPDEAAAPGPVWVYPGFGSAKEVTAPEEELNELREKLNAKRRLLGEWPSTSICGNDILSSVLYSSGIVGKKAGKLAPIALAMVAAVLYFFRFIYEEVVTAIPLNGGSYNALLNTTSKRVAAFGSGSWYLVVPGYWCRVEYIGHLLHPHGDRHSARWWHDRIAVRVRSAEPSGYHGEFACGDGAVLPPRARAYSACGVLADSRDQEPADVQGQHED